ncbi:MAG: glycosyltransferase family 2 protein [Bacteroidales bacterium]|nr:glycosyltransferase family 2 protein [Bacteroidales bacterium]
MKRIAVLMTVHNRRETTLRCLQLLYRQQYDISRFSVDVFMTNDGCTDGTDDAVRNQFPDAQIIQGDGSLYWNRGMYEAWKVAEQQDFDYYLWLNDDTLLYCNSISELLACSVRQNNSVIVVGSVCEHGNKTKITYGGCSARGVLIQDVFQEQTCDLMNGNLVLIPRKVYQLLGKNNPKYHHALGDFDYAKRALEQSVKIVLAKGVFGECNRKKQLWKDSKQSLCVRFKDYWKYTGANPFDVFVYNKQYKGNLRACLYFLTSITRMLFPAVCERLGYE